MASCELRDELICSVCLGVFTDPATLICGHSFCRHCITGVLKSQKGGNGYSCPTCRKKFKRRPLLQRNVALRSISQRLQAAPNQQGCLHIFCTYCLQGPVPAIKHCQLCQASLCDEHLRVHCKTPEHALSELSTSVGVRSCPTHRELLEYYCTEDAACLCATCKASDHHRHHQLQPLLEAAENKKEKLRKVLKTLTSRRDKADEQEERLGNRYNELTEEAFMISTRVATLFKHLDKQISDLKKKTNVNISVKKDKATSPLLDRIQRLKMQQEELSGRIHAIEELCNMADPLTVLQEQETGCSYCPKAEDEEPTSDTIELDQDFISETLYSNLMEMVVATSKWFSVLPPTRFLLDVNTAANNIHVSQRLTFASWTERNQKRADAPERFRSRQVMSSTSISSGRHYCDLEVEGSGQWRIGMCYPSMERCGDRSYIGSDDRSWGLCCTSEGLLTMMHNGQETVVTSKISYKFRICLDYEAGRLSFFDFSDSGVQHLHTFTATFSEPLHAVFYLWKSLFCRNWLKIIS